ncbi:hypothetical protein NDU88_003933 [Pleurodeles waltl]|uniref:Uncharacterized protein n=1 Tax=Pleurodeles waltl TaxID=8319 RepID=A0AAV7SHB8_PLEWA|nr:hypothetical protein NDU88_003933 [Pleurodeles waltl]
MSETLHSFSFCRVSGCHFFSPPESDASIRSAFSGPGTPCIVFTHPAVFASEIQPHDDPKTTQHGLRSHQPLSAMLFPFYSPRRQSLGCVAGEHQFSAVKP